MTDTVNMTDSNDIIIIIMVWPDTVFMIADFTVAVAYVKLKLTIICVRS